MIIAIMKTTMLIRMQMVTEGGGGEEDGDI